MSLAVVNSYRFGSEFVFPDESDIIARLEAAFKVLNGSDISELTDQSPEGNDVLQAVAANQPFWNSSNSNFNNKPTADFNDADDEFMASAAFAGGDISQPNTIIAVLRLVDTTFQKGIFDGLASGGRNALLSHANGYRMYSGTGTTTGGTLDTNPHILVMQYDDPDSFMYVDGGTPIINSQPTGTDPMDGIKLAVDSSGTLHKSLELAEFVVWNALLSDANINLVGNHYDEKYGISWTDI